MAPDGEGEESHRQTIFRETRRSGALILQYPFDRARRVELAAGVVQTTRQQIVTSAFYSGETHELLSESRETHPRRQGLNVASSAGALVFDTAAFGPLSPIQGQRARLEVAPTFGSVNFTSVLVDYRRYFMPVAFYTIAARVIHLGRYGTDAEDARLPPLYLNDPGLVRGYGRPTYVSPDCATMRPDECYSTDRLIGSRLLVGNLELRVPLLRPFGAAAGMYGPIPVEVALFADSGAVWRSGDAPATASGSRTGIASVGLAFRIGLGFAIVEVDAQRPLRDSEDRWTLGFNLMPGW